MASSSFYSTTNPDPDLVPDYSSTFSQAISLSNQAIALAPGAIAAGNLVSANLTAINAAVAAGVSAQGDALSAGSSASSATASAASALASANAAAASAATAASYGTGALFKANNLSDLTNLATARTNLGLGTFATKNAAAISDITSLQTTLDGKAALSHTHAQADITGLSTTLAGKANTTHTHTIADVTSLQTTLDNKSALGHTHTIADVASLQTTLNGKAASSHTHAIADVSGLQTTLDGKQPVGAYLTSVNYSQVTAALGFTPANVGGQEFVGQVTVPYLLIRKQNTAYEGGEMMLEKAPNSTLNGNVILDQNYNSVRIFEGASPYRGVYVDLGTAGSQSKLWHEDNLTNLNQLTNGPGYISGITSANVTTALGYTPYNATNPNGYISGITSANVTTALGYTPYNSTNPNGYISGISSGNVTTALGYTPVNKAGDTLTGKLWQSSEGFVVADVSNNGDITQRIDSGFFQYSGTTLAKGWPTNNNNWGHLISSTHSNGANYYSLQIAAEFYGQDIYTRTTNGSGTTGWSKQWSSSNLTNLNQLTNGPGYISGINSGNVTTALGYTPANKAGESFTGNIGAPQFLTNQGGYGSSALISGDASHPGYLAVYNPNGTRAGYIGWQVGTRLHMQAENGLTGFEFSQQPYVNSSTYWTAANLTNLNQLTNGPGYISGITSGNVTTALGYTPANAAGQAFSGDIATYRDASPTTGAIYFGNTGTRYLYWDAANYWLNGAHLYTLAGRVYGTGDFSWSTGAAGNTLVQRDANGWIYNTYFNSTDDVSAGNISYVMAKFGDNYYRSASQQKLWNFIGDGGYYTTTARIGSNSVGSDFTSSAIQLRETNLVANAQTGITYAPQLGFHWGGIAAAALAMHSDGNFYFRAQGYTGTQYRDVTANAFKTGGGAIYQSDGNIYMPWTGNYLSDQLGGKAGLAAPNSFSNIHNYFGTGTTAYRTRIGELWGGAGVYADSGDLHLGASSSVIRFQNSAAYLSGGNFTATGIIQASGYLHTAGNSVYIDGPGNRHVWFRTDAGVNRGIVYHDNASDSVNINLYDTSGTYQKTFAFRQSGVFDFPGGSMPANGDLFMNWYNGNISSWYDTRVARAWGNSYWNGSTNVLDASFNCTSITRNGVGDYTVTHNALKDHRSAIVVSPHYTASTLTVAHNVYSQSSTQFRVLFSTNAGGPVDTSFNFIIFNNNW